MPGLLIPVSVQQRDGFLRTVVLDAYSPRLKGVVQRVSNPPNTAI
jgi:hypothetical protein